MDSSIKVAFFDKAAYIVRTVFCQSLLPLHDAFPPATTT